MSRSFPMCLHRWFQRGEGWAFHSSLDLENIVRGIGRTTFNDTNPYRREDGYVPTFVSSYVGGQLIGIHMPDSNCPDPLARDRFPTIFVVAVASNYLNDEEQRRIQEMLLIYKYPELSGPDPELYCVLE